MRTLKLVNNDFELVSGSLTMLEGVEALAQNIQNRLKMWRGEWFAALTSGVDYLTLFDQKLLVQQKARKAFRDVILAESRITNLKSMDITFDNATRTMSVYFVAESTEGLIEGAV